MRALTDNWRYAQSGQRDLRLDLLRGFAVFAMAIDHIGGGHALHLLTGGNRFFVSAAEAFVFVSGVTVGMVYGRYTMGAATRRGLGRAWTLYAVAIWLGLAFAAGAALLDLPKGTAFAADPARFVRDIVLMRRTFYLVDVMLLYAFLMALAPVAIWLLKRGWWPPLLLVSAALWLDFQLWPSTTHVPWYIVDNAIFHFAAWQVLFFVGLILGYYRDSLGSLLGRVSLRRLPGGALGPLLITVGLLVWLHVTDARIIDRFTGAGEGARLLDSWFDKSSLPLPRLLACLLVFAFAWTLVTRAWRPINAFLGPLLLPLGRAALYAYAAHVVIVFVVEAARAQLQDASVPGPLSADNVTLTIELSGLAALWVAARFRVGQSFVSWLGSPPFRGAGQRPAWNPMPRPAFSLVAVALLSFTAWQGLVRGDAAASAEANAAEARAAEAAGPEAVQALTARRQAYNNPVTTVTPSRLPKGRPTASAPATAGGSEGTSPATDGTLFSDTFFSAALGRKMSYAIYLPAAYEIDLERTFPVLYMLHGAGGDYTEWPRYGMQGAADTLMESGEIAPMIIVMPEGDLGYWVNGLSGAGEAWADYLLLDLLPHIEAKYRTIASPQGRALGGISRGAFGAFDLALKYPGVFGALGLHSPALGEYADLQAPAIPESRFGEYDPIALARSNDLNSLPAIYFDIGLEDDWLPGAQLLHAIFLARGIEHTFNEFEGGHSGAYWESMEATYLRFYDLALRNGPLIRITPPSEPRQDEVPANEPPADGTPRAASADVTPAEGSATEGGANLSP